MSSPRIALIHAVSVAMEPIRTALSGGWPNAEAVNLLDDSLSTDRARPGHLTPAVTDRIVSLAFYAHGLGARGILFTCSAFGPAIELANDRLRIPVLKPNEAMFESAIAKGRRIGMLATFEPAVALMEAEFKVTARSLGVDAHLRTTLVTGAMEALKAGDVDTHNRLVADQAAALGDCDAVMLAHFSTSRAAEAVRRVLGATVLTSPDAAVTKLRRLVTGV